MYVDFEDNENCIKSDNLILKLSFSDDGDCDGIFVLNRLTNNLSFIASIDENVVLGMWHDIVMASCLSFDRDDLDKILSHYSDWEEMRMVNKFN